MRKISSSNVLFISGMRKCGTTFLANMLDGNPGLNVMPPEVNIMNLFKREMKKVVSREDILNTLCELVLFPNKVMPYESEMDLKYKMYLREEFESEPIENLFDILNRIYSAFTRASQEFPVAATFTNNDSDYFAWKQVGHYPYYDDYFSHFVEGRLLHISRDPRAFYNSKIKSEVQKRSLSKWNHMGNMMYLKHWIREYEKEQDYIIKIQAKYGAKKVKLLRYEDLLIQTKEEMDSIFHWLDLDMPTNYETTILGYPCYSKTLSNKVTLGGVNANRMEAWKKELPQYIIFIIDLLLRKHLSKSAHGYKPHFANRNQNNVHSLNDIELTKCKDPSTKTQSHVKK